MLKLAYRDHVGSQPIIAESARKRGVSDEDMLQAHANPFRVFERTSASRWMIGANHASIIFEAGVIDGAETPVIVHAMRAREKSLR